MTSPFGQIKQEGFGQHERYAVQSPPSPYSSRGPEQPPLPPPSPNYPPPPPRGEHQKQHSNGRSPRHDVDVYSR